METHVFPSENYYILLSISPSTTEELTIRKTLSDALAQSFGQTSANLTMDLLWVKKDGNQCVLRVHEKHVTMVLASITAATEKPRLSVLQASPFLASLVR